MGSPRPRVAMPRMRAPCAATIDASGVEDVLWTANPRLSSSRSTGGIIWPMLRM